MKKIFSILLALALVLSVGLVTGMPVQADVGQPQVTVSPVRTSAVAQYTIFFTITASLSAVADNITVEFPDDTTVPGTGNYSTGAIRVNAQNISSGDVTVSGRKVTVKAPISISAPGPVTVVFTTGANITNPPTTGDYTLWVNTSEAADQTPVVSAEYAIRDVPAVTDVSPGRGNAGGTMWVVITGTSFMGNKDTNVSATNISFGVGAVVDRTKYISVTEINVRINVNALGTFPVTVTVTAQTPAGNSTTNGNFTANAAGIKQVDVWQKYTPTDLIFNADTLVFNSTTGNITAAILAASQNYTLLAHSGLYVEDLTIDKKGLTLMSVSGKNATTIRGVADLPDASWPLAAPNIQILSNSAKISGFTITSPTLAADRYSSGIVLTGTNHEIFNNAFVFVGTSTSYGVGIQTYRVDAMPTSNITGLKIYNNTFSSSGVFQYYVGVFINRDNTNGLVTVSGNAFTGNIAQGIANEGSNAVISGNTLTNSYGGTYASWGIGILDFTAPPRDQENLAITGNTVSGFSRGILIGHSSGTQVLNNITVKTNTVTGNKIGILVRSSAGGVVVNYNDIAGNTELGLNNTDDENLNALYNWWGHAIGPHHDTLNPGGQHNAVTGNVTFSPWLYKSQEQFAHDAPCLAGSVVLANEATKVIVSNVTSYFGGWNSFSTPVTLDSSANKVSQLLALAAASNLSIVRAQRFDLTSQAWVFVIMNDSVYGADYPIKPGEGFYIQVRSKGSLPILVETGTTSPPMRPLVAGWNLIGLSSLEAETVATALSGVSYSMVLSPKPPNDVAWSVTPAGAAAKKLLLGEAYWVAMGAPGILFGFTYTPVAYNMTWELNQ